MVHYVIHLEDKSTLLVAEDSATHILFEGGIFHPREVEGVDDGGSRQKQIQPVPRPRYDPFINVYTELPARGAIVSPNEILTVNAYGSITKFVGKNLAAYGDLSDIAIYDGGAYSTNFPMTEQYGTVGEPIDIETESYPTIGRKNYKRVIRQLESLLREEWT